MDNKPDIRSFVTEAFDYLSTLEKCSEVLRVNKYLLEHIASGFAKYGRTPEAFIQHVDEWIVTIVTIYPELGFDHEKCQIEATIDLVDQVVVVDQFLIDRLAMCIDIIEKYGLLISYKSKKRNIDNTTTIGRFFEYIQTQYPDIKDRYKGLGSSNSKVSREVIMDPRTRRIVRVTFANYEETTQKLGNLVGDSRHDIAARKELLLDFKFTADMIDN